MPTTRSCARARGRGDRDRVADAQAVLARPVLLQRRPRGPARIGAPRHVAGSRRAAALGVEARDPHLARCAAGSACPRASRRMKHARRPWPGSATPGVVRGSLERRASGSVPLACAGRRSGRVVPARGVDQLRRRSGGSCRRAAARRRPCRRRARRRAPVSAERSVRVRSWRSAERVEASAAPRSARRGRRRCRRRPASALPASGCSVPKNVDRRAAVDRPRTSPAIAPSRRKTTRSAIAAAARVVGDHHDRAGPRRG